MTVDPAAPFRASPAYEAHLAADARFHVNSGWRRVDYFGVNESPEYEHLRPAGVDGPAWSTAVPAEHHAVREAAGLFDLATFGKIEIAGPGAAQFLEWVCANRVARGVGQLTYTQMLNPEGGVIGDVTVARLAEELFVMITNTGVLAHDLAYLRSQLASPDLRLDSPVVITDLTNAWACFGVFGPRARDVLAPLVGASLATADFPFLTTQTTELDGVPVRLARVTFVGELGWEVYVPTGWGRWLWQRLSDGVAAVGGRRCAFLAIDSLRSEKGYLYLGDDIRSDRTPYESGLGRFVSRTKDFIGRGALEGKEHPAEMLRTIAIDAPPLALRGGEVVHGPSGLTAKLTSGGVGYTVGGCIGFVYLPAELPTDAALTVEVGGRQFAARQVEQPIHDPANARIRA